MGRETIYWIIVLITFLYIIRKNYKSHLKILIILCFYSGLASFLGKSVENPYKIIVVLLSAQLLYKYNGLSLLSTKYQLFFFSIILFSFSFIYSAFLNGDYFNLTFSQYGKYFTPFCLIFVFNRILYLNPDYFDKVKELLYTLLTIQIILTFVKILTIGMQETTVGSIAYIGGGPATILPVLGFILVWVIKYGNLKREEWVFTFLLFLIGIVSFKRAILFIMPVFIFLFMYYVPKKLKTNHLFFALPLIPLIFYLGVRINPTLNKEGKIGGSFDFQYVFNYTQKYSFGKTTESPEIQLGQGRGGATFLLYNKLIGSNSLSTSDFWGVGLREVYTTDYEQFENNNYGVNSKGSITGIYQSYLTAGYIGVFATIILLISIIWLIKEPRVRITLALLILWDYLFYSGLILRTQALGLLFFFIIVYSNFQFEHRLIAKNIGLKKTIQN